MREGIERKCPTPLHGPAKERNLTPLYDTADGKKRYIVTA